jgi:hypothetical protein
LGSDIVFVLFPCNSGFYGFRSCCCEVLCKVWRKKPEWIFGKREYLLLFLWVFTE